MFSECHFSDLPCFSFIRLLILCITFLFSACLLFCGKTLCKTSIYPSKGWCDPNMIWPVLYTCFERISITFCKADVKRLLSVIKLCEKNLNYCLGNFNWKDDTDWYTSLKCPWKYFFFASLSCQGSAESVAGKIPVFNLLCLRAFQQTYGSAAKASIFILICAYNSSSEISSRCAQRH